MKVLIEGCLMTSGKYLCLLIIILSIFFLCVKPLNLVFAESDWRQQWRRARD